MNGFMQPSVTLRRCLGLALTMLYLAGCSIPTPNTHEQSNQVSPQLIQQHQQRLDSIFRWTLSARLALFQKRTDERDGVYLDWQWQRQEQTQQLRFSHPLRGQLATLRIQPQQSTLSYDGNDYQDRTASGLLHRLFDTPVPVKELSRWAIGQYTPRLTAVQYLADGRIGEAQYNDPLNRQWQINWFYPDLTSETETVNSSQLPEQVHLESTDFRIKLQMNDWQLTVQDANND